MLLDEGLVLPKESSNGGGRMRLPAGDEFIEGQV
jgi:hypothetical protein